MKTIYFAAPLFTLAERRLNEQLSEELKKLLNDEVFIILPQTFSLKFPKDNRWFLNLFNECIKGIEACDIVVAILDGADSDSGTCVELGYAYAKNKPVIGIRTDFRASEDRGLNLMVSHVCTDLLLEPVADISVLAGMIADRLKSFFKYL
jgi:nucleoside 2-deoxyribosyltransferase